MLPSFLLPRLVQREEIADIGGDHGAVLGSSIPGMRLVLGTSHRHSSCGVMHAI
jgi:hypothetical protein